MNRDPMSWSIPVFRLFGIQVKVHIFFIVVVSAFIVRIGGDVVGLWG